MVIVNHSWSSSPEININEAVFTPGQSQGKITEFKLAEILF
jgi:hypothetical protein